MPVDGLQREKDPAQSHGADGYDNLREQQQLAGQTSHKYVHHRLNRQAAEKRGISLRCFNKKYCVEVHCHALQPYPRQRPKTQKKVITTSCLGLRLSPDTYR